MALTIGVGNAADLVLNSGTDPLDPIAQEALDAVGGTRDFVDRLAVLGVFITILGAAGLGVITTSSSNPPFVNQILRVYPLIVGFIAFTTFSTEAWSVLDGSWDYAANNDGYNAYILFLASSMVSAVVSLFRN